MTKMDWRKTRLERRIRDHRSERTGKDLTDFHQDGGLRSDDTSLPVKGRKPGDLLRAFTPKRNTLKKSIVSTIIFKLREIDAMSWSDSNLRPCCDSELREAKQICQELVKRVDCHPNRSVNVQNTLASAPRAKQSEEEECIGSKLVREYQMTYSLTKNSEELKKRSDSDYRDCRDLCYQIIRDLTDVIDRRARLKKRSVN